MNKKIYIFSIIVLGIFLNTISFATGLEKVSLAKVIIQLIFYLVIFAGVIFLTIYGTRLIASNYKGIVSSKYMNILDTLSLPGGIKLVITTVGNKVYILSVSNTGTTVVDIIDDNEFPFEEEAFENYFNKYMDKWNKNPSINKKIDGVIGKLFTRKDKEDTKNESKD